MPRQQELLVLGAASLFACTASPGRLEPSANPVVVPESYGDEHKPESRQAAASVEGMYPPPLRHSEQALPVPRQALLETLQAGLPRLLAQVTLEPVRVEGRFFGFRVVDLPRVATEKWLVARGDIVVRVNQHGLQRPEQVQEIWESLSAARELVIEVVRGDQPSTVHIPISDDSLAPTAEASSIH